MKNKHHNLVAVIAAGALVLAAVVPAFAQTGSPAGTTSDGKYHGRLGGGANASGTAMTNLINRETARGAQEITQRTNALNALFSRINAMVNVTSSDKTALETFIQNQIAAMNQLQSKIAADADADATSSLKADIRSIADGFRIYMLVLPRGAITAAGDRTMTIVAMLQTVGKKIQARISAAQASGTDVTAMQSTYTDFAAKLADAGTQAQAAISEVASLSPDNGNQTQMQANVAALKDARMKIQAAQKDLSAARKDVGTIVKGLAGMKTPAAAATTTRGGVHGRQ